MSRTVNGDVPDLKTIAESALRETELLSTDVHDVDHAEWHVVHQACHPSTEDVLSAQHVTNNSNCSLSAEKVNKLKLMHRGSCRYNEVRCLCTFLNWKLMLAHTANFYLTCAVNLQ